jgi:RNase P subunit RPR2
MLTTGMDNRARSGMACSECNDLLVAPKSSAYVSNHEVRHVWSCENCGHEIEMAVTLGFDATSAQSNSLESTAVA